MFDNNDKSKNGTNGRISYNQYKLADIMMFLLIMCVCELVNILAIRSWFTGMTFSVSVMLLVSLVVIIRWNWLGVLFPVIDGVLYCLMMGAEGWQYAVYVIGNAFVALTAVDFLFIPKEKIVGRWWATALYALVAYVLLVFGRSVVAVCFGKSFVGTILATAAAESLNLTFALIGLLVLRRVEGMLADQKKYLFKVTKERDTIKHAEEYHWDGYTELNEEDLQALAAMDEYDKAIKFNKRSLKEIKENGGENEAEEQ